MGRGKGRTKGTGATASVASRKATSRCKVCDQQGHWAADAECPGKAPVNEAHTVSTGRHDAPYTDAHSVYVFDIRMATDVTDVHDLSRGIVDTATGCSAWTNDSLPRARSAGLGSLISQAPSQEKSRFGDGRVVLATEMSPPPPPSRISR